MNSNQEIIESRLATYIDGDLDGGDRAEIEKYLQQNPQHRRLLEELRRGRELVRGLPREAVPPEFADAFNSQLERAGLLDGNLVVSEPRLRIGAWPRVLAAAAILFLTVGLAIIVYFVLPGHGYRQMVIADRKITPPALPKPPPPVVSDVERRAVAPVPANGPSEDRALIQNRQETPAAPQPVDEVLKKAAEREKDVAGASLGSALDSRSSAKSEIVSRDAALDVLAADVSNDQRVKQLLEVPAANSARAQAQAPADALVMVVRSPDPQIIQKDLDLYFRNMGIDWQPAPQSTEWALNNTLAQQQGGQLIQEAPSPQLAAQAAEQKDTNYRLKEGATPGAPAPSAALRQANSAAAPAPVASAESPNPPSAPPAPTAVMQRAPTPQVARAERESGLASRAAPSAVNSLYVARGLSRQQADEVTVFLARSGQIAQASVPQRIGEIELAANSDRDNKIDTSLARRSTHDETQEAAKRQAEQSLPGGDGHPAPSAAPTAMDKPAAGVARYLGDIKGPAGLPQTAPSNAVLADGAAKSALTANMGKGSNAPAAAGAGRGGIAFGQAGTPPLESRDQQRAVTPGTERGPGAPSTQAAAGNAKPVLVDVVIVVQKGEVLQTTAPSAALAAPATQPAGTP